MGRRGGGGAAECLSINVYVPVKHLLMQLPSLLVAARGRIRRVGRASLSLGEETFSAGFSCIRCR